MTPHIRTLDLFEIESSIDDSYALTVSEKHRKKFGQFFTPDCVADCMADWIAPIKPYYILDPALGSGSLLRATNRKLSYEFSFDGFEIDKNLASFLTRHDECLNLRNLFVEDFLTAKIERTYDAIIMNPPYLRHHDLNYDCDIHALISKIGNIKISKLANSYLLFVIKACELLRPGGRAAVIIPTEWANANFGKALKDYLIGNNYLREMLYFSNAAEVFSGALTTACILFIEKENIPIEKIAVSYLPCLDNLNITRIKAASLIKYIDADKLRYASKWDYLVKNGDVAEFPGFVPLSNLAYTKRGIATGANNYFHLSLAEIQRLQIKLSHTISCVGKAQDVKDFVFTNQDYNKLVEENKRTHLLVFDSSISDEERGYITQGEAFGLPSRFLLSKRKPWYFMEKRAPAPIWACVFSRENLKFIYNEAMVSNLTTFHGIYPYDTNPEFVRALTVTLNSNLVQEQARSHVRVYGGGLFKFEPKDILNIKVPNLVGASKGTIKRLSDYLCSMGNLSYRDDIDALVMAAANESLTRTTQLL